MKGNILIKWTGITIGAISFLMIGVFHSIVIKCEYYFIEKVWPFFLIGSIVSCISSLFISNVILSSTLAVLGFTMSWCIGELKEQTKHVRKGWFLENPNRKEK